MKLKWLLYERNDEGCVVIGFYGVLNFRKDMFSGSES